MTLQSVLGCQVCSALEKQSVPRSKVFRGVKCSLVQSVPQPSTGPKTFWAGPNYFVQDQKMHFFIVPTPNFLCQTKRWFPFSKFSFCASTKLIGAALNAIQFFGLTQKYFDWPKTFWDLYEDKAI